MRWLLNFKFVSRILVLALLHLCWLTATGWAEMVPTESTLQSAEDVPAPSDRQRLLDFLQREDIQVKLQKYGISQQEATARINSLSDQELSEIADKAKLAAGGHSLDEHVEDAIADLILEIFLWIALIGFIALAYFVGLLFKSVACPFQEECRDVLRPWWDSGEGVLAPAPEFVAPVPSYETPLAPNDGPGYGLGSECDARVQACEWTVR